MTFVEALGRHPDPEIVDKLMVYALKLTSPDAGHFMKATKGVQNKQILSKEPPAIGEYATGRRKHRGAERKLRRERMQSVVCGNDLA